MVWHRTYGSNAVQIVLGIAEYLSSSLPWPGWLVFLLTVLLGSGRCNHGVAFGERAAAVEQVVAAVALTQHICSGTATRDNWYGRMD
jgi:hypothetical protein